MDLPDNIVEPIGRRGLSSVVHGGKLYIYGGYSNHFPDAVQNKLDVFDFTKLEWTSVHTEGTYPKSFSGCSCVVIGDCIYVFGGWYLFSGDGMRSADVYRLNLTNLTWKTLAAVNPEEGPLRKDKAGMCDYGTEMVCVMGGYGCPSEGLVRQKGASYHWDTTSYFEICWTNELHLFHTKTCKWISPVTTGTRPLPCAAFSFTRVDRHRVILFGGRQHDERTDHLYILDMEKWHWSGPIFPASPDSPWPSKRSFHAACPLVDPNFTCTSSSPALLKRFDWLPCVTPALSSPDDVDRELCLDPKLLVLWGMDNESDPVNDVWILHVNTLTWEKVILPSSAGPARIWHTAGSYHPAPHTTSVIVLGGTHQNLFKYSEPHISNVQKSTFLHFGLCESLFSLTLRVIAEDLEVYSSLLSHLPGQLQDAIISEHHMLKMEKMYSFIDCNKVRMQQN